MDLLSLALSALTPGVNLPEFCCISQCLFLRQAHISSKMIMEPCKQASELGMLQDVQKRSSHEFWANQSVVRKGCENDKSFEIRF